MNEELHACTCACIHLLFGFRLVSLEIKEQKLVCFSSCLQGMSVWGPGESTYFDKTSDGNADLLRISLPRSGDHMIPLGLASPPPWGS